MSTANDLCVNPTSQARKAEEAIAETYLWAGVFVFRDRWGNVSLRMTTESKDKAIVLPIETVQEFLRWLADERLLPGQETKR